jgi:hypothetical protein
MDSVTLSAIAFAILAAILAYAISGRIGPLATA